MGFNAIVIDDEKKARQLLRTTLEEYCPTVTTVYEAEDLMSGVEIIKRERPQIVFLDIEMPEHSGLQLLDFLDKDDLTFEIIFTTAYSEYAIEAFQFSAIDYLLKPLRPKQVQLAVEKAEKSIGRNQIHNRLNELSHIFKNNSFHKIALPISDGIFFMELDDIICFQADGMYTKVYTVSKGEILISKPLKHFDTMMQDRPHFYRPHRSFIINMGHIKQYIKKEGSYLIMDNGMTVSISKERKEELLQFIDQI
ncbi:response regulator transcription factor [Aquimarina sp. MMG016]|nr:response regulator transcription factor [Aquimarina sp. MMG016]